MIAIRSSQIVDGRNATTHGSVCTHTLGSTCTGSFTTTLSPSPSSSPPSLPLPYHSALRSANRLSPPVAARPARSADSLAPPCGHFGRFDVCPVLLLLLSTTVVVLKEYSFEPTNLFNVVYKRVLV